MADRFDVVILGSGPGGYVCALRAAQLGLRVACVEKAPTLGGTCLNVGCIPSKALLESSERYEAIREHAGDHGISVGDVGFDLGAMLARKDAIVRELTGGIELLFQKQKVTWVKGTGRLAGKGAVAVRGEGGERRLEADAIVLATGSEPTPLKGVPFDGDRVIGSTEALALPEVPGRLIVVGAGVVGLELGSVWRRLGAEVTVVEYLDRILPFMDVELSKQALRLFRKQGLGFELGARVTGADVDAEGVTLRWEDGKGEAHEARADRVLVAVGRRPVTEGLGLSEAGVSTDARGRVVVDDRWRTTADGVYALGDVTPGPMLAHKASDEGLAVAELLAGEPGHVNVDAIPWIVYTHPEVAGVGQTEEQLTEAGVPYRKGRSKYAPNGRAMGLGERDGFVKLLAHAETDRLLGAHILGARAGDLIAELAVAIEFGASAEDLARSVHAHPTLAEIVREAAMDVAGRALHR